MAAPSPEPVRTFAFGTAARWGVGFFPGAKGVLVLGGERREGGPVLDARLDGAGEGEPWRVRAEGIELIVAGRGPAAGIVTGGDGEPATGFEQRCTVTGSALDGEAPGCRGERRDAGPIRDAESVRAVIAWFGEQVGAGLVAVRPRKAKAHNADVSTAAVLSPDDAPAVAEARLSTTYTEAGRPARMSLELWSDDPDAYPRRLAGEATGEAVEGSAAGWRVTAEVLDAHLRGEEGTGVYLLGRRA